MNTPTVRQLECFVAVTDALNFRVAAESCHITQPALSAQVQQLEAVLGVRLFERDKRTVIPTEAGAAMSPRARQIISELRDFTEFGHSFRSPLAGTLRLGVIPTAAPYVLPGAIAEVNRCYPELRLLLHEAQTDEIVRLLKDGKLDLLVLALEAEIGDLETLPLFSERFLLAVPPQHRLAQRKRIAEKDLREEQVLLLEDGHCLRDQVLSICENAGACEVGDFRASSLTTLVQMVASGVGVTLLPEMAVQAGGWTERRLQIIPFGGRGPVRTIGLAWRPSSARESEFRLLGEAILRGLGRG